MKRWLSFVLLSVLAIMLVGCEHEHQWSEATCTAPSTCKKCGETVGTELGHSAPDLTCTVNALCERCGELMEAPGHVVVEATCAVESYCSVCSEVLGEALGHTVEVGVCERCGWENFATVYGSGDDVVEGIALGDNIYRAHFTNSGKRNFIVREYDVNGERELLVNEIGNYDGYVLLVGDSPILFEIKSSGEWSYTIEALPKVPEKSFSGTGDYVTGITYLDGGSWHFTHDGDSNFVVWAYSNDDRDLIVNTIGSYDGNALLTVPAGSYTFFEITADGNWTIEKAE